ncbi:Putative ribonuclease H protein [Dendrobium catenatum]|uniref:Ribonuclease H protein n=1 Tax=Dendrobium catenatum TaxID=906689 RepID=A0A2I0XDN5_9ASPA|nr:Putative ribonuclease H protein [Dendrobium catenatum]
MLDPIPIGSTIPPNLVSSLIILVTDLEIHDVVFAGSSSKAPGPDGFTFEFYKETWEIIGTHVCKAVKQFFSTGFLPRGAKATAIVLIPKGSHASNILDYRPISLCNVFYKIIAKIISNRMREVMPFIINSSQAGFIKDRMSTDNVVLASDILRDFTGNGREKLFCAKLDIRKAFDTISRTFLLNRLLEKGFPPQFVGWIKGCIEDVYFSVSINGGLEGFFSSSFGLRQGCPLSPLLFSVVMDAFSYGLTASNFKGIFSNNLMINHLLYADNILVFGEASIQNANSLQIVLSSFAMHSGLVVNNAKCRILFSHNNPLANVITARLGFTQTENTLTYLGIPISTKKLKTSHLQPLLSRLSTLLAGWKVKFLSFAGRIQFLKFTIVNTIAYRIRGAVIPKGICRHIEKLCSKFLIHGTHSEKKLHLIAWTKTCLPKCYGGLGLPSLDALAFAFGCSFLWRYFNSPSLVAAWFRNKFSSPWKPCLPNASKFWKGIADIALKIKDKLNFHVINENCTLSMLWDPWCHGNSGLGAALSSRLIGVVGDFIIDGCWSLPSQLDPSVYTSITSTPILVHPHPQVSWNGMNLPSFKVFLMEFYSELNIVPWFKFVWHSHYALKYASFTWLAMLGGLKTADVLAKRNIFLPPACPLCRNEDESIVHCFFQCDFSFFVISTLLPSLNNFLLHPNLHQVFQFVDGVENWKVF